MTAWYAVGAGTGTWLLSCNPTRLQSEAVADLAIVPKAAVRDESLSNGSAAAYAMQTVRSEHLKLPRQSRAVL
ncbi:hypothetical protein [Polaromonas sp.]|uniref:hypothetical protein n=1 Tax=Polaromonas sp. TaxID=1869339 RepID=UPI0025F4F326|nr:hypothetical protein [Polaromonas sp.]